MENNNQNLINQEEILQALGLDNLEPEQKTQVLDGLMNHFSELILETLVDSLSDSQAKELDDILTHRPDQFENRVGEMSSQIPGMYAKVQQVIRQEVEVLKSGYDHIK